jgi:hypothetical protein
MMMGCKLAIVAGIAMLAGIALMPVAPACALSLSSLIGNSSEPDSIKKIHVAELVALMHNPRAHVIIYDVNLHDVRAKYGVIPGARLLSSADGYDLSELPADKHAKLVFYCTNLH